MLQNFFCRICTYSKVYNVDQTSPGGRSELAEDACACPNRFSKCEFIEKIDQILKIGP